MKESNLKNNVPDFHWFQLQGVKVLAAVNEPDSKETLDSELVLNEAISTLVQSYNEIYNNQVIQLLFFINIFVCTFLFLTYNIYIYNCIVYILCV